MPLYKVISKELLDEWLNELLLDLLEVYNNPNKYSIAYLVMNLYEYTQVSCKLKILGQDYNGKASVSVSDIKVFTDAEDLNYTANYFMSLRNSVGHGYISDRMLKDFINFVCSDNLVQLLGKVGIDSGVISSINKVKCRLKSENNYNNCLTDCSKLLEVVDGSSKHTVFEAKNLLSTKYSEVMLNKALVETVGNHYVVR